MSTHSEDVSADPMMVHKDRVVEAHAILTKYSALAFGGGVIPFPLMDVVAVSGIQLKMLTELFKLYDIEFVENWGKSTVSALVGGLGPHALAVGVVGSLIKAIPVFGTAVGFATMPALAAAATYAVGKVFIQHFESGGTFLNFDSNAAKAAFKDQFLAAKAYFIKRKKIDPDGEPIIIPDPSPPPAPATRKPQAAAPASPVAQEAAAAPPETPTAEPPAISPMRRRRRASGQAQSGI